MYADISQSFVKSKNDRTIAMHSYDDTVEYAEVKHQPTEEKTLNSKANLSRNNSCSSWYLTLSITM